MELLSHGTPYIVVLVSYYRQIRGDGTIISWYTVLSIVSYQDEHCVTLLDSANKLYNTLHENAENQCKCLAMFDPECEQPL